MSVLSLSILSITNVDADVSPYQGKDYFRIVVEVDGEAKSTCLGNSEPSSLSVSWNHTFHFTTTRASRVLFSIRAFALSTGQIVQIGEDIQLSVGELLSRRDATNETSLTIMGDGLTYGPRLNLVVTEAAERVLPPNIVPVHDCIGQLRVLAASMTNSVQQKRSLANLSVAMTVQRAILDFYPTGHPNRAGALSSLASTLWMCCQVSKNDAILSETIKYEEELVSLHPPGDPDRHSALAGVAGSYFTRYQAQGNVVDLVSAIRQGEEAIELQSKDHRHRRMYLGNLALCYQERNTLLGDEADLHRAIELQEEAIALPASGGPDHWLQLSNLSKSLLARYRLRGSLDDLQRCVVLSEEAVSIQPQDHPDRGSMLDALGVVLTSRYQEQGNTSDLEQAIRLHQEALSLILPGHPSRPIATANLARDLLFQYTLDGDLAKLHRVIALLEEALAHHTAGNVYRPLSLGMLSFSLLTRYEVQGNSDDLYRSLELALEALPLHPEGHSERPACLRHLAICLRARYSLQGNVQDFHQAIEYQEEALRLMPPHHAERHRALDQLSCSLHRRYRLLWNKADLLQAISLQRDVLAMMPPSHPQRIYSVGNMAICLHSSFELSQDMQEFNEVIALEQEALSLAPRGHSDRNQCLANLGTSLQTRFDYQGDLADLHQAINLQEEALELRISSNSIHQSTTTAYLANALLQRHRTQGKNPLVPGTKPLSTEGGANDDVVEAFRLYGTLKGLIPSTELCLAAREWVYHAELYNHPSVLDAYQTAISTLDRYAAASSSVVRRHQVLPPGLMTLVNDAFSCALRKNDPETAVQLLEQGRGILWTQLARFTTPLEELSSRGGDGEVLAKEFRRLSILLQQFTTSQETPGSNSGDSSRSLTTPVVRRDYIELEREWSCIVDQIRVQDGFARFLLPPLFAHLREAAREGPVIIVNTSKYTSDALIILHTQSPIHVPLSLDQEAIINLSSRFSRLIRDFPSASQKVESQDSDSQSRLREYRNMLITQLRFLWNAVVQPVMEQLEDIHPIGGRIWWCPAAQFPSLPLHAAGPYRKGQKNLSGLYVSSYTPSLSALARARSRSTPSATLSASQPSSASDLPTFALVGQAKPLTGAELQNVEQEFEAIREVLPGSMSLDRLDDDLATDEGVVNVLQTHSWAHLACHGNQDFSQPFNSSFAMKNGPLTLLRIIQTKLGNPEFAFLSACHTAVVDKSTPDEVIHLGAAMQFAGFKSVIATMWGVDDGYAHVMVKAFYKNMFEGIPDYRRAAECLNKAANRDVVGSVPIDQRIVFIHIGA
ncbi:hypothetical protein HYDPIDRAFT_31523 [Hydnomerulius pinastri MD-312]|uniref:CHAT domain-containing protein n=1 Tax=Hydnomerulius pinastri MD-312 TaxID=994086 RepID=A0A0C9VTF3_9AGAM|nr:hypothetical protein HYDPIDRAFT_31523 [Hydnomerulius pinastri MD-312]